jgi:probable phosphoglycerate mutase
MQSKNKLLELQNEFVQLHQKLSCNASAQAAKAILENTTANNILVCMHGRAMKSFLCLILNKPLNEMERFQHTNLCLYQLQKKDNQIELIKSNDTSHLL